MTMGEREGKWLVRSSEAHVYVSLRFRAIVVTTRTDIYIFVTSPTLGYERRVRRRDEHGI